MAREAATALGEEAACRRGVLGGESYEEAGRPSTAVAGSSSRMIGSICMGETTSVSSCGAS